MTDACPSIPRIHRLPPALANQIAAGEVVERPASVAKELLENSLDAGARQLEVEAEEAGVRLLRVRDDGVGMLREDLLLALDRHATSKLSEPEDLQRVATLGFRGEALPSIASVSRLVLSSRPAVAPEGWQVRVEGGGPAQGPAPVPHPPGTTVEVRDLFYNVPARRKFLRGPRTELAHLTEVARRVALARFEIGLRLRHDRRELLALRPALDEAGRTRRVAEVCGQAFLDTALFVEAEREGLRLAGWVGLPESARAQGDLQYLFLNGRPVRDRLLVHAVRQAYQDRVYPGRHPAFVLYLELDPGLVDVNVHPTKQEVRFREARTVHDFVARGVARAFGGSGDLAAASAPDGPGGGVGGRSAPPSAALLAREPAPRYGMPATGGERAPAGPLGRALGRVLGRYLVAAGARGLVLVDGPAAAALLAREHLTRALASGVVPSRPLLLPATVPVPAAEADAAEARQAACLALGVDLERSGPATVMLRRVPTVLQDLGPERVVRAVLGALAAAPAAEPPNGQRERVLAALAAEAGAGFAAGADGRALDDLLRALEAIGEGGWPPGLWRELGGEELQRLVGGPGSDRGPAGP
jgi:DNA mismatch repair protein MutL